MAWVTAFLCVLLVPCHFWVSCGVSVRLFMSSFGLVVVTSVFSLADKSERKAWPFGLAIVGLMGHGLCAH